MVYDDKIPIYFVAQLQTSIFDLLSVICYYTLFVWL